MAVDYSLMTKKTKENEKVQQAAYQYVMERMSNPVVAAVSNTSEVNSRVQGQMEGQYFASDANGIYNVLPKRYRDSQAHQKITNSILPPNIDLSDDVSRVNATAQLSTYMATKGLHYDNSYTTPTGETKPMIRPDDESKNDLTEWDLSLLTDTYNMINNANATATAAVDLAKLGELDAQAEQDARQAAVDSDKYTFESNPEGAYNAVISDVATEVAELQEKADEPMWWEYIGAWFTGRDLDAEREQAQKDLADAQLYLAVLEDKKAALNPKDYDPNYMMYSYVGGERGTAEAYIEDAERDLDQTTGEINSKNRPKGVLTGDWRQDRAAILEDIGVDRSTTEGEEGEGGESNNAAGNTNSESGSGPISPIGDPEEYRAKMIQDIQDDRTIEEQADEVKGLKQRDWQEKEGVKRPAIEGKVLVQKDFEEKAKEGATVFPEISAFDGRSVEKEAVRFINNPEYAQYKLLQAGAQTTSGVELEWQQMTEEEKDIIRYYAANDDYDSIKTYLEAITPDLQTRLTGVTDQMLYNFGHDYPVLGWLASTASGMVSFPAWIYSAGVAVSNAITGEERPVDTNSRFFVPARVSSQTMAGATADASANVKWLAETMSSAVQSIGITTVAGPAATAIMASNAAGQASYEASQIEGITADKVALAGATAGTIEYLTEKVGVGKLLDTIKAGKGVSKSMVKEVLEQAGIEGTEELTAEIANNIANRIVLGEDSEYEQYVDELVASGISRDRAEEIANKEFFWNRPVEAAISGFAAGGTSSSLVHVANTGVSTVRNVQTGKAIKTSGQTVDTINAGLAQPTDSAAYKSATKAVNKVESGKPVSNWRVGDVATKTEQSKVDVAASEARYAQANDSKIVEFAERAKKATPSDRAKMTINIGSITNADATQIRRNMGANVQGYTITLDGDAATKINDVGKVKYLVDNADQIKPITNAKGTTVGIEYLKSVGAETYHVGADINAEAKTLSITSVSHSIQNSGRTVQVQAANNTASTKMVSRRTMESRVRSNQNRSTATAPYTSSYTAASIPNMAATEVNRILDGELLNTRLQQQGITRSEYQNRIEQANGKLLKGLDKKARQNAVWQLMAGDVMRNTDPAKLTNRAAKRDYRKASQTWKEINNENISAGSSKRDVGADTGRQGRRMESRPTEAREAEQKGTKQRTAKRQREVAKKRETTYAKSRIQPEKIDGVGPAKIIPENQYDSELKAIKSKYTRKGLDVDFVVGDIKVKTNDGGSMPARGVYVDGKIYAKANNGYTATQLAEHEYYHAVATRQSTNQIIKRLKQAYDTQTMQQLEETYREAYTGCHDSLAEIREEIAADAYSQINAFEGMDSDLYQDISKVVDVLNVRTDNKNVKFTVNPEFEAQYDAWDGKTLGKYFNVGRTSEALKSIGLEDKQIYWDKSKIIKIKKNHPEMDDATIKAVPQILEDPIIIMQSNTVANRVVVLGELQAADGRPILAALELRPTTKSGRILDYVKIASAYGRNKVQTLIEGSDILYIHPDKNRTNAWADAIRLQLPAGLLTKRGSIHKVTYVDKNVNGKISFDDSSGKTAIELAFENAQKKSKPKPSVAINPMEIARLKKETANTTPKLPKNRQHQGDKTSKFKKSLKKQTIFDEQFKKLALDSRTATTYDRIANKDTMEAANKALNDGGQAYVDRWRSKKPTEATAEDIATGFILMHRYQAIGDYQGAVTVAEHLREMGTSAGQTVQAMSIMGRLEPEGMLLYAQGTLDKAFQRMIEGKTKAWIAENKDRYKLSERDTEYILRRTTQASVLPDGRDKSILLGEVAALIQRKLPPTKGAGIRALSRISMLLNPRTNVRNILGNVTIMPQHIVSDFLGSGIDRIVARRTGTRTTGTFGAKALKGMAKGAYESFDDFRRKISTRAMGGDRYEIGDGYSFRSDTKLGRVLNSLDRICSFALEVGDRPFYETWFVNSLNNQMRLNNVNEPTTQMIEIARDEALERTWQDNNGATRAARRIRDAFNAINIRGYGLGDVILPFVKTPANLTKAIIDFSPVGVVRALSSDASKLNRAIKDGTATPAMQRAFTKRLSQGITGTLITALQAILAASGLVTGAGDEDKDVAAFEKNILGMRPYSIKIGDQYYSYEWMQPQGTSMAIIADTVKALKSGKSDDAGSAITNALKTGGNVLFEQSLLSSVGELFSQDGFVPGIVEAVLGEGSKFTPQILGQIAQLGDDKVRTSYVYGDDLQTAWNQIKAKIPGLRQQLEPVVDVLGREVEANNDVFNVFFNPSNTGKARPTAASEEMYRLYQATGDKGVIPPVADRYIMSGGEKIVLTPKQYTAYQKSMGQFAAGEIEKIIDLESYKALSDNEKAEVIKDIYSQAKALAKEEVADIPLNKTAANIKEGSELARLGTGEYLIYKYNLGKIEKTETQTAADQKRAAIASDDHLTTAQKNDLLEALGLQTKKDKTKNTTATPNTSSTLSPAQNEIATQAQYIGVTKDQYVSYGLDRMDANNSGRISQAEAKAALDNTPLSTEQKAYIWALQDGGRWKPEKNPYIEGYTVY